MRLYKMELYKLFHRKAFIVSSAAMFLLLLFFWGIQLDAERAVLDGISYEGYEAVQVNKQITEGFAGELTDEKIREIVETYGLPKVVVSNYPGFRDANYLSSFVTEYFSDGYMYDWDNYKIPTKVYPISETEFGELEKVMGEKILFSYTAGWKVFLEVLQMGMMLGSILIIMGTSVIFAEESQTKMLQLLFTTKEGKRNDIRAKIAAAVTLSMAVFMGVVIMDLVLCGLVYGFQGTDCPVGIVMSVLNVNSPGTHMAVGKFVMLSLVYCMLAALSLCAVNLWISAHCKTSFHAVTISAICWGAPVLVRILLGGIGYLLASWTPIFLVMTNNILDLCYLSKNLMLPAAVSLSLFLTGTLRAYHSYKLQAVS